MSKRTSTTYTEEFRKSSAKLALDSDEPAYKIAQNLGVNPATLAGWLRKYFPKKGKTFQENSDPNAELIRLKRENARLIQERYILKKATAYFASQTL